MKLTNEQVEQIRYGMHEGWWNRFGEAFVSDLEEVITKHGVKENIFGETDFHIDDVKEKFGSLRMYSNAPEEWDDHLDAWEYISAHTCIVCGKFPVFTYTTGWICPVCKKCAGKEHLGKLKEDKVQNLTNEIVYKVYSKEKDYDKHIDMKPFYKKIRYNQDN